MIAYIKGKILKKNSASLVIASNGLGYEVYVPLNDFHKFLEQDEIELVTYLHVREDLMQLYGFQKWEERDVFLLLINVSGIGPKGALAILSNISIQQLIQAIGTDDIGVLTKLPGVGKKTAQRLIIELKDKMPNSLPDNKEMFDESVVLGSDLVDALVSLGYQSVEVKKILSQLLKEYPDKEESFLLKKALQILARI